LTVRFAIALILLSGCRYNDISRDPLPNVPPFDSSKPDPDTIKIPADTIGVPIDTVEIPTDTIVAREPELCSATWSKDIQTIISTRCAKPACHAEGSGRTPLTSYAKVFEARFMIRVRVESGAMPYDGPLPPDQKQKILCWIEGGALEN
jgi:hypothetical protein